MATTIQLKRAKAERWRELNVVLQAGEPGFVIDENKFKIGDGTTAWNDLPYIGDGNVFNAPTKSGFPATGNPNVIYKAEQERLIYQWNSIELKYEPLNTAELSGSLVIDLINGGNANG